MGIWNVNRNEPLRNFTWGVDTITSVVFNKVLYMMIFHSNLHICVTSIIGFPYFIF